jgi:hypothetical protein
MDVLQACAGPGHDILAMAAGPVSHLLQAAFWAGLAAIFISAGKGRWKFEDGFDKREGFAASLFLASSWVRSFNRLVTVDSVLVHPI